MDTLFDRIGGRAAVNAAVDVFYAKVLADDRINRFFEGINMKMQKSKQKAFLTYAFGGAPDYSGQSMRATHKSLVEDRGLNDNHFDIVAGCLRATLEDLDVPADLIQEVMVIAESTRDDVLNK